MKPKVDWHKTGLAQEDKKTGQKKDMVRTNRQHRRKLKMTGQKTNSNIKGKTDREKAEGEMTGTGRQRNIEQKMIKDKITGQTR